MAGDAVKLIARALGKHEFVLPSPDWFWDGVGQRLYVNVAEPDEPAVNLIIWRERLLG